MKSLAPLLPHHNFLLRCFCDSLFSKLNHVVGVIVLPDPLRGIGVSRKTMESQKLDNSSGPAPEVVERERVTKEQVE